MISTVLLTILLNSHIGQMYKHVIHLCDVGRVKLIAKPSETLVINVSLDGPVACHKH